MTRRPFEATFEELRTRIDEFASFVLSCLDPGFVVVRKEKGFVEYLAFEAGYQALKDATRGFTTFDPAVVFQTALQTPIVLVVLRTILEATPPEWSSMTIRFTGVEISRAAMCRLDRSIRICPAKPIGRGRKTMDRVRALVQTACQVLAEGTSQAATDSLQSQDGADTTNGLVSLHAMARLDVPYPRYLYMRFLGRPFAGHKGSVPELIGDRLEVRIEEALASAGISYRKTKRAEKIPGFDQAPDFIIPDEFNPQVVIEAKIAEDDGTARDKVTRIVNLATQSDKRARLQGKTRYDVVACIGGRGFGIRREDVRRLLEATQGKVFTLKHLDRLVECTRLRDFKTQEPTTSLPLAADPEEDEGDDAS